MDAIDNQLGVAERQCTRDNDDDYDRNYVDNRSDDDHDDDGRGGLVEMAVGEGTTKIATPNTMTSRMEAGDGGGGRGRGQEAEALT
jgi:hypothetical protein